MRRPSRGRRAAARRSATSPVSTGSVGVGGNGSGGGHASRATARGGRASPPTAASPSGPVTGVTVARPSGGLSRRSPWCSATTTRGGGHAEQAPRPFPDAIGRAVPHVSPITAL